VPEDPKIHSLPKLVGARDSAPAGPAVKIELDERCFLFPDGKVVKHVVIAAERNLVTIDAVFDFNETRRSPRIIELSLPDAAGFARELVNAAYYAKTSFFLSDGLQATINVAQHGCLIEFLKFDAKVELMVSVPATWRLIKGILSAIDSRAPTVSH
jgi:hypothetical protein